MDIMDLVLAIAEADVSVVRRLVKRRANIEEFTTIGLTPLAARSWLSVLTYCAFFWRMALILIGP